MSTGILVNNAYRRAVEWQLLFYFPDVLFPDFDNDEFDKANDLISSDSE